MAKSTAYANSLLLLMFNMTAFATMAKKTSDVSGVTDVASIFASLHTADPGTTGDQTTSEMTVGAYNTYARVAVVRSASGWTITSNSCSPLAQVTFPAGVSGSGASAGWFGLGTLTSGAGVRMYSGTITPPIACGAGVTPGLSTASTIVET